MNQITNSNPLERPSSKTLRVGYVLKRFPNLSQTFILNEILELERQGVSIDIFSLRKPRLEPTHNALNKLNAQITYSEDVDNKSETSLAEAVAAWAKSRQIQHLHAHFATSAAETAMQAAKFAKIDYSFTAHARDIFHYKIDQKALAERMQHAHFVVTVSDYNRDFLKKLLEKHSCQGNVRRLYNGLDLDEFAPSQATPEPGLIVSIGRLVPKKGMAFLIEACASLRDRNINFRTVIIGDGEERNALADKVHILKLENYVTLVGALAQSDVVDYLSRAEVFALPCIIAEDGDVDGLPTVILEAMALGIPVVSTRLVGIPEMIVHEQNGLLVEQQQTAELTYALQTLLESDELKAKYRHQSLERMAELFDLRKNVAQLKQWFAVAKDNELLHGRR